ncbi:Imm10 family immunity protein [Brachybacterium sp. DNPG3]
MIRAGFIRSTEDGYEAIVLLDEESGDTIEVQRSLAPDPQDAELGMDTYAIVRGGAAVHYGGLDRFALEGGSLVLDLDAGAAGALDLPQQVELVLDAEAAAVVAEHLPRIVSPTERTERTEPMEPADPTD